MIVDFLSLLAGVAACSGAVLAPAGKAGVNPLLRWTIGLLLGFSCFAFLRGSLKITFKRLNLYEQKLSPPRLMLVWTLCFTSFVWIVASAFIGIGAVQIIASLGR